VLIMYFWGALIAFATVAFSVGRTELYAVRVGMVLCVLGILFLLMPRFKPHAPRIAERFLPPRYRRTADADADATVGSVVAENPDQLPDADANEPTDVEALPERLDPAVVLSAEDEDLLRRIGTGAHAAGRHSGVSGQTAR
jgi:UDP-GlcNAc:undecaprenyl-phosphate GlcNAc-1-phosphate transferase